MRYYIYFHRRQPFHLFDDYNLKHLKSTLALATDLLTFIFKQNSILLEFTGTLFYSVHLQAPNFILRIKLIHLSHLQHVHVYLYNFKFLLVPPSFFMLGRKISTTLKVLIWNDFHLYLMTSLSFSKKQSKRN